MDAITNDVMRKCLDNWNPPSLGEKKETTPMDRLCKGAPERTGGRARLAEKGAPGKGRQRLSPPSAGETPSAISAPAMVALATTRASGL